VAHLINIRYKGKEKSAPSSLAMSNYFVDKIKQLYRFIIDTMDPECSKVLRENDVYDAQTLVETILKKNDKESQQYLINCMNRRVESRRDLKYLFTSLLVSLFAIYANRTEHVELLDAIHTKDESAIKEIASKVINDTKTTIREKNKQMWAQYAASNNPLDRQRILDKIATLTSPEYVIKYLRKYHPTRKKDIAYVLTERNDS